MRKRAHTDSQLAPKIVNVHIASANGPDVRVRHERIVLEKMAHVAEHGVNVIPRPTRAIPRFYPGLKDAAIHAAKLDHQVTKRQFLLEIPACRDRRFLALDWVNLHMAFSTFQIRKQS